MASQRVERVELLVAGAGMQSLTLCSYLLVNCAKYWPLLRVADRAEWMSDWKRLFAAQEIATLRSPDTHHPYPRAGALADYVQTHEPGSNNLQQVGGAPWLTRPTTEPFHTFCDRLVDRMRLNQAPLRLNTNVESLENERRGVVVTMDDGRIVRARRAVVATNAAQPRMPLWAEDAQRRLAEGNGSARIVHSSQFDPTTGNPHLRGRDVLVIGGGMTAYQVALAAARRGAHVVVAARNDVLVQPFDFPPEALHPETQRAFLRETSWSDRHAIVRASHRPSVTVEMSELLHRAIGGRDTAVKTSGGSVELLEGWEVTTVGHDPGGQVAVTLSSTRVLSVQRVRRRAFDTIVLATGMAYDVQKDPLVQHLLGQTEVIGGLPVLNEDLTIPETNVAMMGPATMLLVGPTGSNIAGARHAATRICGSIVPLWTGYEQTPMPPGANLLSTAARDGLTWVAGLSSGPGFLQPPGWGQHIFNHGRPTQPGMSSRTL